jgi:hypothetical protein
VVPERVLLDVCFRYLPLMTHVLFCIQVLSPAELLKQQVEAQQQMLRVQQEQLEQQQQQIEALRQQRAREEEAEERRRARESVLAARGRRQTLANPTQPNASNTVSSAQVHKSRYRA